MKIKDIEALPQGTKLKFRIVPWENHIVVNFVEINYDLLDMKVIVENRKLGVFIFTEPENIIGIEVI